MRLLAGSRLGRARAPAAALIVACAALSGGPYPSDAASTSGKAFTVRVHASASARSAFREALAVLSGGRLNHIAVRSALADRSDHFVEGFVAATDGGTPVEGVVFAGTSGVAGVVVDSPGALRRTFPALVQELRRMMTRGSRPASAPAAEPLRTVSFGSGTIGLPESWQVLAAYQGCVEAASTRDHGYIALGCPQAAIVPPGLPGTNPRAQLVVPFSSPVEVLSAIARRPPPVGLGLGALRIAEVQRIDAAIPNARAAYILFDYRVNNAPFRGLAMVSIAPIDGMSFMVYKSMFMLPADSFPRLAPAMWRSWQSWGVSTSVLNGRLVSAAQSMREAGDLITGAYWERQHAYAGVNAGFDQYIRDTATVEHLGSGNRYEGNYLDARAIVDHDPTTYRIVPASELTPR